MACDINLGRLEPCKDSVGGITAIYIGGAYTDNLLTTATISADGEVTAFAAALTFYKYDLKGANSFDQTNGFSTLRYTGNGVDGAYLAHGLGKVPKLMIVKRLTDNGSHDWYVYHASLGNQKYLKLNEKPNYL